MGLLDKRLIFVTGKGGTGKTTVATAVGMVAARRGKRAVVIEVSAQDRIPQIYGQRADVYVETELEENLFSLSVDSEHAMEEYLVDQLKLKPLADLLTRSKTFMYLAAAAPGLPELLVAGKIWELAQTERRDKHQEPFDIAIVDAPSTGHCVGLLRTPKNFQEIARSGPVARHGAQIDASFSDSELTGVIAVSIPEQMSVNELDTLEQELKKAPGLDIDLTVLNMRLPDRFKEREAKELRSTLEESDDTAVRGALRAALFAHTRAKSQRNEVARLKEKVHSELTQLPFLFREQLGVADVARLADRLELAL